MTDPARPPDSRPHTTPRWVKVMGIIVAVAVVAIVIAALAGGEHGPGRHTPDSDGEHSPPMQHSP